MRLPHVFLRFILFSPFFLRDRPPSLIHRDRRCGPPTNMLTCYTFVEPLKCLPFLLFLAPPFPFFKYRYVRLGFPLSLRASVRLSLGSPPCVPIERGVVRTTARTDFLLPPSVSFVGRIPFALRVPLAPGAVSLMTLALLLFVDPHTDTTIVILFCPVHSLRSYFVLPFRSHRKSSREIRLFRAPIRSRLVFFLAWRRESTKGCVVVSFLLPVPAVFQTVDFLPPPVSPPVFIKGSLSSIRGEWIASPVSASIRPWRTVLLPEFLPRLWFGRLNIPAPGLPAVIFPSFEGPAPAQGFTTRVRCRLPQTFACGRSGCSSPPPCVSYGQGAA